MIQAMKLPVSMEAGVPRISEFYGILIYMYYRDHMILRIREVRVCGPHSLRLTFNDETTKQVNVLPLLEGMIFEPLRDPAYFASATLDPICGTVVWPNGADIAPEALHELEAELLSASAARSGTSTAL